MRLHGSLRLNAFRLALLGAALVLSSCGWLISPEGGERSLQLRGHDPVGYFMAGIAMPGRTEFGVEHRGAWYRFANETNRRLFITNPERYTPQFGGLCANGMVYALPVDGESDAFKIIDGRLYLFASRRARLYFEMEQDRNLRLAWHYWEREVQDSTRWVQSVRRYVFRVPHYKSSDELAAEYERRLSAKPSG